MNVTAMGEAQVQEALAHLDGWEGDATGIHRTFVFGDFVEAFGWMSRVALIAEKMNHHPDWSNVYRTVEVKLNTHDAGGVTELDFQLAAHMDRMGTQ